MDPAAKDMLEQQRTIFDLRKEVAELKLSSAHVDVLLAIIERHYRAWRAIGWTPPEDESAIVTAIKGGR